MITSVNSYLSDVKRSMNMAQKTVIVKPAGAVSVAEWGADRHRLIERSNDELREIAREILAVRTALAVAERDA